MAAIAGELSKQIKGHSEGEKGFRPWWDTVEDNLLYAFVMLGMVSLPMTFFSKTPIECTPHPDTWENYTSPKGLTRFYPKVYCTEMMIEPFLLYLPFTLLMVPMVLTAIEKTYVILYQVEDKMNKFYSLLVKESLNNEDVYNLAKDNVKDCHELEQAFKTSNACYSSYLYRTLLEILMSGLLALMFSFYWGSAGIGVPFFDCTVHNHVFQCIVPNSQFFLYTYVGSFVLIGAYLFCSVYNFLWIVSPKVGILSRFLDGCEKQVDDSYLPTRKRSKLKPGPTIRLRLYFKQGAHDFSMLMNLLAESQGLPDALRILSLFEHQFAMLWEPRNIRLFQRKSEPCEIRRCLQKAESEKPGYPGSDDEDEKEALERLSGKNLQSLIIGWNDCEIADYFYSCFKRKLCLEYSVEMSPETEAPIKSILYYQDSSWMQCENMELLGSTFATAVEKGGRKQSTSMPRKYTVSFDGLEPGKTYNFMFSTEINGMTITQVLRQFECTEM